MTVFVIFLTVGIASVLANPSSNYTKNGECQVTIIPVSFSAFEYYIIIALKSFGKQACEVELFIPSLQHQQTCVYDYSVKQEYFGQKEQQNFSIISTVEIDCHSGEQLQIMHTQLMHSGLK